MALSVPPARLAMPTGHERRAPGFVASRTRAAAARRGLLRGEIELHLGAVGIVKEELPSARLGLAAEVVFDAAALELGQHIGQAARGEGHVVEDAGAALGQGAAGDDVENGAAADIEPGAREVEGRAVAL